MYATWKYFEALFGTPDAVEVPRDEDDDPPEQHDGCEAHIALDSKQTPLDRKEPSDQRRQQATGSKS
jgi:hypothetical protein